MSFLSNTSFGSNTSAFDFGNIAGSAIQAGQTSRGGIDAGDAANAALDAAASAIPFGSMVKDFLDGIGLQRNIDNVLEFGLSSWGAATSPDEMEKVLAEKYFSHVQSLLQGITGSNLQRVLNEVELFLTMNDKVYEKLRRDHAKAGSTQAAYDLARKKLKSAKNEILNGIISNFKEKGIVIKSTSKSFPATQPVFYNPRHGQTINDNGLIGSVLLRTFTVDASSFQKVEVDENGEVKTVKSGGFGLLALGSGLLYAVKSGAIKI